jgi:hypothetical protein
MHDLKRFPKAALMTFRQWRESGQSLVTDRMDESLHPADHNENAESLGRGAAG